MREDSIETSTGNKLQFIHLGGYSLTTSYRSREFCHMTEVAAAMHSIQETCRIVRTS